MRGPELDERKAAVLEAVVRDHIRSAEPVGSGTVARRYRLGVSPATVRNDMAALEALGYLTQPYTSAGRIPTDRGYRFYVDGLPRRIPLPVDYRRAISAVPTEPVVDVEEVLRQASHVLSEVTGYAAIALTPEPDESRILGAEVMTIGDAVLLLVVGSGGRIEKRVIATETTPDEKTLHRLDHVVTKETIGRTLAEAQARLERVAETAPQSDRALLEAAARTLGEIGAEPSVDHVLIGGAANIAAEDAFERRETARRIFEALERETPIRRFLRQVTSSATQAEVRIGRENPLRAMREASVVTVGYLIGDRLAGAVAVLGPTRMAYPSAMSAVRAIAGRVSSALEPFAG